MIRRKAFAPVLAAVLALPFSAAAQEGAAPVGDAEAGADLYALYCATCHGQAAEGMGPTAELLTIEPTNLTRLAESNDGVFPVARVVRRIDGRDPVLAHGSPMPVFGPFFEGEGAALRTPAGQPILTSQPVADLVAWLMTIQEEG